MTLGLEERRLLETVSISRQRRYGFAIRLPEAHWYSANPNFCRTQSAIREKLWPQDLFGDQKNSRNKKNVHALNHQSMSSFDVSNSAYGLTLEMTQGYARLFIFSTVNDRIPSGNSFASQQTVQFIKPSAGCKTEFYDVKLCHRALSKMHDSSPRHHTARLYSVLLITLSCDFLSPKTRCNATTLRFYFPVSTSSDWQDHQHADWAHRYRIWYKWRLEMPLEQKKSESRKTRKKFSDDGTAAAICIWTLYWSLCKYAAWERIAGRELTEVTQSFENQPSLSLDIHDVTCKAIICVCLATTHIQKQQALAL